jgi:dihydrofolate synthase/folylpolyglutamate synthase
LPAIHIAGTNGKGTTGALLASIFQAAGYRVGLYTSPHLVRFNERIRINGAKIRNEDIVNFLHKYRPLIDEIDTTFFETTTALAFDYFRRNQVDLAILETGLGGRFDATNVITPLLSVITPIGKDHEKFLGYTLAEISREKAGIIKPGVPCVVTKQRRDVKRILLKAAELQRSRFRYAPDYGRISIVDQHMEGQIVSLKTPEYCLERVQLPLAGNHQIENLQTVLGVLGQLTDFIVSPQAIRKGVETVCWHGRLEMLSRKPLILYDVGHNLHGIRRIVAALKALDPVAKYDILIALGQRKNIYSLGEILGKIARRVYLSELPETKSVTVRRLTVEFTKVISPDNIISNHDFSSLLTEIVPSLRNDSRLLILGSHYIAPAIYKYFQINI